MSELLVSVVPLALVDAVSVGALALPVWFLLSPRTRLACVGVYLAVLALAYASLGIVVASGADAWRGALDDVLESTAVRSAQGIAGAALLVVAMWFGLVHRARVRPAGDGFFERWRDAAVGDRARLRVTVGLALVATVAEIPTAIPYAIALTRIDDAGIGYSGSVIAIVTYTAVMVVPALGLTAAAALARTRVAGVLGRVDRWFRVNAQENTAWLIALVGLALFFDTPLYHSVMDTVS